MIQRIGVICQDRNSFGFLMGLRARLQCEAEIIDSPTIVGKSQYLTKRQAKNAVAHFRKKSVDLIVRLTDADDDRWQDVRRGELKVLEDAAGEAAVCGVAVRNTELWLNLMRDYLAEKLGISPAEVSTSDDPTGRIKHAISKARRDGENTSEVVARVVGEAPSLAFRKMLEHDSFRTFYNDCRARAIQADCPVPNELSADTSED
jgi:hypothetical protein